MGLTRIGRRVRLVHPAALVSTVLCIGFGVIFSAIAVHLQRSFSTLAWDLGIYDQAYWLVSRFGDTFITVRGLDVWAHHVNLIAYLYAPFYWMGAGPEFLVISQALVLALGGLPVYLIARQRLASPWLACALVLAYVLYAPLQWLSLADYHPEALVVTPLLFAWYFADCKAWRAFAISGLLVIITREDAALPLLLLGALLSWRHRSLRSTERATFWAGPITMALCVAYYLICTRLVIPHFNGGEPPYFFAEFYGEWGGSPGRVAVNVVTDPARVLREATQPDRLKFYRDLLAPLGWLSLLALPIVGLCSVQMLGSVIGASPYARMAVYQYTAMMIAPLVLAAIVGIGWCLRRQRWRHVTVAWVVGCALVTNIAWSPSPISTKYREIVGPNEVAPTFRTALALIPSNARVAATYHFVPHLSGRRYIYDWPNPFVTTYWGNRDENPHDPGTIEWIIVAPADVDPPYVDLVVELTAAGGEFAVVMRTDDVVVARRVRPPASAPASPATPG